MQKHSILSRKTHFLGSKVRALRKRNGLTLVELSTRCMQIDAEKAPSVSYLSLIENSQRNPSEEIVRNEEKPQSNLLIDDDNPVIYGNDMEIPAFIRRQHE